MTRKDFDVDKEYGPATDGPPFDVICEECGHAFYLDDAVRGGCPECGEEISQEDIVDHEDGPEWDPVDEYYDRD